MGLISVLVLAACGGSEDNEDSAGDAGEFAVDLVQMMEKNQASRAYELLHPDHQSLVDEHLYIDCETATPGEVVDISVDEVYEESTTFPEIGEVDSTAVTLLFTDGEYSAYHTIHLIDVDGEWRWGLAAEPLEAYKSGECPE